MKKFHHNCFLCSLKCPVFSLDKLKIVLGIETGIFLNFSYVCLGVWGVYTGVFHMFASKAHQGGS